MPKPIQNLIVISDTHCGCQLGLYPPRGVRLDEGGRYRPTTFQKKLWRMWRSFWTDWVPTVTRGKPYAVVHNGDAMEGVHHQAISQITQNRNSQKRIAYEVLKPVVDLCDGRYYHERGSEAHSGPSSEYEEALAEDLEAIPNQEGQHARYDLWIEVGKALVHCMHHIGTTGTTHYETTALMKELVEQYADSARWGQRAPDFVIRSHRHRSIEVRFPTWRDFAVGCVTPGWQGKTPHAWKIAGARVTTPHFGGVCVCQGDEEAYLRSKFWTISRSKTERITDAKRR